MVVNSCHGVFFPPVFWLGRCEKPNSGPRCSGHVSLSVNARVTLLFLRSRVTARLLQYSENPTLIRFNTLPISHGDRGRSLCCGGRWRQRHDTQSVLLIWITLILLLISIRIDRNVTYAQIIDVILRHNYLFDFQLKLSIQ